MFDERSEPLGETRMKIQLSIALMLLILASPVAAHHSFAAFDQGKQVTLTGVVQEFQWTNPHSWLIVKVKGPDGIAIAVQEWGNPQGPEILFIHGFSQSSLCWLKQFADSSLAREFRMAAFDVP